MDRLRALKVAPNMSISLLDVGTPLFAAGFSREEITAALNALEQESIVTQAPGNRLLILREPEG